MAGSYYFVTVHRKIDLNIAIGVVSLCIPLFSFSSPGHTYTVPRSLSPFLCSLLPVPRSLFPVPCSLVPLSSVCFACSLLPVTVSRSLFSVLCFPFSVPVPGSLFPVPYSLFPIPCSLFYVLCSLFSVLCSLFPVPCSLFPVPRSLLLFPVLYSLFSVYRSLSSHFLFPKFEVNKARQTDRQTPPSSPGCRTFMQDSCYFIQLPRSTFASLRARK